MSQLSTLHAPLWIEFRDTAWGGLLYATLVLGGVAVLFAYALALGELVVKWLSRAARSRPGVLGSLTVIGRTDGSAEGKELLGVLMAIWPSFVVVGMAAGLLVLVWRRASRRWYSHGEQQIDV